MPMISEIAPLVIVTKLEGYDYAGAASVGVAMILISMAALMITNGAQVMLARRIRR
jgi:sulfate transport system permease protein